MRSPAARRGACYGVAPMQVAHSDAEEVGRLLSVLPGKPAPFAGRIPNRKPAKDRYVRFDLATWVDLQGFLQDRKARVRWARGGETKARAVQWQEDLQRKMRLLAPYMVHNPTMTVAEACRRLQQEQRQAGGHGRS